MSKYSLSSKDIQVGDSLRLLTVSMTPKAIIMGAAATRDWQPLHHDYQWATGTAGTRDIILNAPSQAGWISRFVTDWAGPEARLARMKFRMKNSICPSDALTISGTVVAASDGGACGTWVELVVELTVAGEVRTSAEVKIAVPTAVTGVRPWACPDLEWLP